MKFLIRLITGMATLVALFWVVADPKFDSWVAFLSTFAAFALTFVSAAAQKSQSQVVGNQSNGIQAGRDANVQIGTDAKGDRAG